MSGTTTAIPTPGGMPQPTTQNPYGMSAGMMALMQSLQGMGKALDSSTPNSSQYMRPNPGQAWSQGVPGNNLLATILQMRNAQTQGLTTPYGPGVAMPRVSLLQG